MALRRLALSLALVLATSGDSSAALAQKPWRPLAEMGQRLVAAGQHWLVRRFSGLQPHVNGWRSANARTFRNIARGDYRNQLVLFRDAEMTAFVDWTDRGHPYFNRDATLDGSAHIRPDAAHVLVIPNQEFEHIGATLTGRIDASDLDRTKRLMDSAAQLGQALGLGHIEVFENSAQAVSVGWQHIHLLGDKPAGFRYPRSLSPPKPASSGSAR